MTCQVLVVPLGSHADANSFGGNAGLQRAEGFFRSGQREWRPMSSTAPIALATRPAVARADMD